MIWIGFVFFYGLGCFEVLKLLFTVCFFSYGQCMQVTAIVCRKSTFVVACFSFIPTNVGVTYYDAGMMSCLFFTAADPLALSSINTQ